MINAPDYHLRELDLARKAGSDRRGLPVIPAGCRRVLDVGCGAGQTLMACDLGDAAAFGGDFDLAALQLGKQLRAPVEMACCQGELLPFRSASFDFLFSRVAMPYMNIPVALAEFYRVLKPSGGLWLTLHPLSMLSWSDALSSPKKAVFELYRLANTAALQLTGAQFRYPLKRSRMESYQTPSGMRRALGRAGFEKVAMECSGPYFIVTAGKP